MVRASRARVVVCLLMAAILSLTTLWVFSRWHVHDPFAARQAMQISQFEHGLLAAESAPVESPAPALLCIGASDQLDVRLLPEIARVLPGSRSPPAFRG